MSLDARSIAMFPLGSVLLPHGPLPLHIFEPRYQALLNDALEADRTFGVVLISRGSEVGGGEQRTSIGTLARIDEHQRFDDGRAAVICHGLHRIEVLDWLPDDPYPRAQVIDLHEAPPTADDGDRLTEARKAFMGMLQTAIEVERLDAVPEIQWATDVAEGIWQLASVAPIGQLDRQSILSEPTPALRLARLVDLIEDVHQDLRLLEDLE